jgi:hypothetical protein
MRTKLVKIGAKVAAHGRYVASDRDPLPVPASQEGETEMMQGAVCPDEAKTG